MSKRTIVPSYTACQNVRLYHRTQHVKTYDCDVTNIVRFRGSIGGVWLFREVLRMGVVGLFSVNWWGVPIFQPMRKKRPGIKALLCTLGVRKLKNHSNEHFWSIYSCFKPVCRNFHDFLQILVDFLLKRRFSRKGRGGVIGCMTA
jgi:hypothetical protein